MSQTRPIVVGIGEILWDLFPGAKQLGGTVTNFVYHATALGANGIIVSSVGTDTLGEEALTQLDAYGLTRDYIREDADHPTATVEVKVESGGEPSYTIHNDVASDFLRRDTALDELSQRADIICYGTLAQRGPVCRETIQSFLATSRPESLRVCDINLRQKFYSREIVMQSLEFASVAKVNDDELLIVADLLNLKGDERQLVSQLAERFDLQVLALTRGAGGSLLFTDGEFHEHGGHVVDVVDTVGAGDCFTAALAMGILAGDGLESIQENANRRAAYVCTQLGGTPPMDGVG